MSGMPQPAFTVPLLPVEQMLYRGDLVCIGRFSCPPGNELFQDSGPATCACIVFPRSTVWIEHAGESRFVADRTTVTLYNRRDRYRRAPIDPRGDHADWIAIAPDVLHDIIAAGDPDATPERPFRTRRVACGASAYLAERSLVQHIVREETPDRLLAEETALSLAAAIAGAGRAPGRQTGRRTADVVEGARALLAGAYRSRLSLAALARALDVSPYRLCHVFRESTGQTLSRHVDRLRLHASIDLLASREGRLVDVAFAAGYSSHSHFTARFRRAFGVTPSEVRRGLTASRRNDLHAQLESSSRTSRRR